MILLLSCLALPGCGGDDPAGTPPPDRPECAKPAPSRTDAHAPESVVPDWGPPARIGAPIATPCPEDAIEISRDGQELYFLFTKDVLENLPPSEIVARPNGTYRARRTGGPGEFGDPAFVDFGQGAAASLDGAPSVSPDGGSVYFHSVRASNTGFQTAPPTDDFLDIYVARLANGEPGVAANLGAPPNSASPDGEPANHPDGVTLYFTSWRPGGLGGSDIWRTRREGAAWSAPANVGAPVNSAANEGQETFTADGDTMYFVSDREASVGIAIYRSARAGGAWGEPRLVMKGIVGEPSLTADGRLLYFVHALSDSAGIFDADVWYAERAP